MSVVRNVLAVAAALLLGGNVIAAGAGGEPEKGGEKKAADVESGICEKCGKSKEDCNCVCDKCGKPKKECTCKPAEAEKKTVPVGEAPVATDGPDAATGKGPDAATGLVKKVKHHIPAQNTLQQERLMVLAFSIAADRGHPMESMMMDG
ncbi:MAG: hypothetical protein LBR78_02830 [Holosporales bacterium]|jgi:hypothetical protein|nr:hypothetical protein [Holosporales bacterium]